MVEDTKGTTFYYECDYSLNIPTRFPKPGEPTRRINLGDALLLAIAFYEEQETLKFIQKHRDYHRNRYKEKIGRELVENMGRPRKHLNEETQKSVENYRANRIKSLEKYRAYRKRRYTNNIEQPLKAEV